MSGFTALPNNAEIEQLRQLAREITASATGPYQRALFLQNYFRDEFIYSLDTPSITSEDAFLEFIARRTGYCEQFASTFAVMARSIGLPARVAIGFTPGQSDGVGGYIVRSQHAHAWPEVWFDGIGWLMFEPTPGRGAPNASYTGVSPQQDDSAPESPTASTTPAISEPGVKGDTASNVQKPAKLETGLVVQVPLFIKEGEVIRVSTVDGTYLGRV